MSGIYVYEYIKISGKNHHGNLKAKVSLEVYVQISG
jgi:hypothetical protein